MNDNQPTAQKRLLMAVALSAVVIMAWSLIFPPQKPAPKPGEPGAVASIAPGADPASVLRVGMLPTWLWLEGRQMALDISALGAAPGDVDAHGVGSRGWRHVNSDAMVPGGGATRAPHGADARGGAPLGCAGYGSLVTVTAAMGLAAAAWAIERAVRAAAAA